MSYDTTTLLEAMRELDRFQPFLLNILCPQVITFDTEEIAFDKINADMKLAPFVSPMVAGKAQRQQGGELRSFVPAYVKPKNVVDPKHVLKRRPGEAIGGALSAAERRNAIRMDLLDIQRRKVKRREEWMIAQILQTGKVVVEGEDYPTAEVDFQRAASHTITLTSTARWGEADAKPSEDMDDWMAMLAAPATHVVMGPGAFRKFVGSGDIEKLLDSRRGSETVLETAPADNYASYKGRLGGGGPEVWVYSGYYKDAAGTKQLFFPDNGVALASVGPGGARCYGAILDAESDYFAAEYWPKNWTTKDPGLEFIMTQSAPLPMVFDPDATLFATVF